MNIYIFYEHLAREWDSLVSLKNYLETNFDYRVYMFSIIFERFKSYHSAKINKPDVVLVPWFVNETHESFIEPLIRINPQLKVINLHQEQISNKAFSPVLIPKTAYSRNGIFHVTWGEYYKSILIDNGVDEKLIDVVGNIRNDTGASITNNKADLATEYHLDFNKKWILFAENRGWILQRNNESVKLDLIAKGVKREDIESCISYQKQSLDLFLNHINSFPSDFFNSFEFIYRPHPGTRIYCDNKCVHVISEKSIYEWIQCCDLYITCDSTSIYEAEFCNKPCATFDLIEEPDNLKMPGITEYYKLDSLHFINDDLIDAIYDYQSKHKAIYENYLGKIDGNSIERLSDFIRYVYKTDFSYTEKIVKPSLYNIIHGYVFELVTKIVVSLNILDKIKFPDSAYVESRDIPYSKNNKNKYKI